MPAFAKFATDTNSHPFWPKATICLPTSGSPATSATWCVRARCCHLVAGGWVRFRFFPETETDWVTAEIVLPAGTHEEKTWAALAHIETQARVLRAEVDGAAYEGPSGVFDHVLSAVGDIPDDVDPA